MSAPVAFTRSPGTQGVTSTMTVETRATDAAERARIQQDQAEAAARARAVFAGLTPRLAPTVTAPAPRRTSSARAAAFGTMPVILTGAIVLGLGLTGPVDSAAAQRKPVSPKPQQSPSTHTLRAALSQLGSAITPGAMSAAAVSTTAAPAVYTVQAGDTVSDVAARFGLSTPAVLAMNGLSWNSLIFPGQKLTLTDAPTKAAADPAPPTDSGRYTVAAGDTVSGIAARFGISTQAVLDANGLGWRSIIYPGQALAIPGTVAATAVGATDAPAAPAVGGDADEVLAMPVSERPTLPGGPAEPAPAPAPVAEHPAAPAPEHEHEAPTAPAPAPAPAVPTAPSTPAPGQITALNVDQRAHAQTIISVGRQLGVPDYGIVIALATAMQESSLRNLSWGHLDSVGLYQQRPSSGWGSPGALQDTVYASRLFYGGPSNPNAGITRGLLDIPGWQGMPLTVAAQAVQISAYPTAYAKWESSAWTWLRELG